MRNLALLFLLFLVAPASGQTCPSCCLLPGQPTPPSCTATPAPTFTPTPTNTPVGPTNTPTPTNTPGGAGGSCQWLIDQGGPSNLADGAFPLSVANDPSTGSIFVAGYFTGTVNFGGITKTSAAATNDIFVAKYSQGGGILWVNTVGATGGDQANSVAVDSSGNAFVTGFFSGTVNFGGGSVTAPTSQSGFLVKYASTGAWLWQRVWGGNSSGNAVAINTAGQAGVNGYFSGSNDFGCGTIASQGSSDVVVLKFDTNGTCLWSKDWGGASSIDFGTSAKWLSTGDLVAGGYFLSSSANFGSGVITNQGGRDAWLARYDGNTGNGVWQRQIGSAGGDFIYGIAVDPSNNVLIAGTYGPGTANFGGGNVTTVTSSGDGYVAKYDSSNTFLWLKDYGVAGSGYAPILSGVATDSNSNVIFTGRVTNDVNFGCGASSGTNSYDPIIVKLNSQGTCQWNKKSTFAFTDEGIGVATDAAGNIYGVGDFGNELDWGCGSPIFSPGKQDGYVVKLAP